MHGDAMRRALVGALLVGCGPGVASPSDATGTTASSASITGSETGSDAPMSTTSTTAPDPGDTTAPDADEGSIVPAPDGGTAGGPCDVWAQDCPRGEKCMPYSPNGDGEFNAVHCTPLDGDPRAPGEPCTVVGSPLSGIDDCERGAICWNVDPETNTGECVAMCQGTEARPMCADPCESCTINAYGTLNLCVGACDPVAQDCGPGEACYPIGETFACAPDASGDAGALGEPCEFINVCDAGLFCAMDGSVPGCEGPGCCAPFCDASGPDPCAALLPGTVCTPWFDAGMEPGACGSTAVVGACRPPA